MCIVLAIFETASSLDQASHGVIDLFSGQFVERKPRARSYRRQAYPEWFRRENE
jgi:hypothetical protein